jgi:SAM-dependent methyltransferase
VANHDSAPGAWPKILPSLTPEQKAIREDFMQYWHEVLPNRYSWLERFNHGFPAARRRDWSVSRIRTLEIGAGLGEHLAHEDLSFQDYTALELRPAMASHISVKYPHVKVIVGDVQEEIASESGNFDRIVAVHVLEHLSNLPAALIEMKRVLKRTGRIEIVLPCEGGLAYKIGRNLSARRLFEARYRCSYDWFIQSEHVNNYWEVMGEIRRYFTIQRTEFWPFRIPVVQANLVLGVIAVPQV